MNAVARVSLPACNRSFGRTEAAMGATRAAKLKMECNRIANDKRAKAKRHEGTIKQL